MKNGFITCRSVLMTGDRKKDPFSTKLEASKKYTTKHIGTNGLQKIIRNSKNYSLIGFSKKMKKAFLIGKTKIMANSALTI